MWISNRLTDGSLIEMALLHPWELRQTTSLNIKIQKFTNFNCLSKQNIFRLILIQGLVNATFLENQDSFVLLISHSLSSFYDSH